MMAQSPDLIQVIPAHGGDPFYVNAAYIADAINELFNSSGAQKSNIRKKSRPRLDAPVEGGNIGGHFKKQGQDMDTQRLQQLSISDLSREFTRALFVKIVTKLLQKKKQSGDNAQQHMMLDSSLKQHVVVLPPRSTIQQQVLNQYLQNRQLIQQTLRETITHRIHNQEDRQFLKRVSQQMMKQSRRRTTPMNPTSIALLKQTTGGARHSMPQLTLDQQGRPVPLPVGQRVDIRTKIVNKFLEALSTLP